VNQLVSHPRDVAPGSVRVQGSGLGGKPPGGLSDDLKLTDHCVSEHGRDEETAPIHSGDIPRNRVDRLEDVVQIDGIVTLHTAPGVRAEPGHGGTG
jgi:hypothetical protein